MCGIAGICQIDATPLTPEAGQWVKAMTDRMAHRGPHQRADRPDLDMHGAPRIVPLRVIGGVGSSKALIAADVEQAKKQNRLCMLFSGNGVPLTQLNGTTRTHVAAFLSAGLNVVSAANGSPAAAPQHHYRSELTSATDRLLGWAQAFDELGSAVRPG